MEFTREPIIETIITPREGYKLVVRSSKTVGQEEFFVDAIELVSFGRSQFFRSLEKPKPFLVPTSDYELLEVREARMVLKHVALDRSIKIGGGKEIVKASREEGDRELPVMPISEGSESSPSSGELLQEKGGGERVLNRPLEKEEREREQRPDRFERKRERRRGYRRKRGREGALGEEGSSENVEGVLIKDEEEEEKEVSPAMTTAEGKLERLLSLPKASSPRSIEGVPIVPAVVASLLPPPPNLISETLARYRKMEGSSPEFLPEGDSLVGNLFEGPVPEEPLFPQETHGETRWEESRDEAQPKERDLFGDAGGEMPEALPLPQEIPPGEEGL